MVFGWIGPVSYRDGWFSTLILFIVWIYLLGVLGELLGVVRCLVRLIVLFLVWFGLVRFDSNRWFSLLIGSIFD